MKINTSSTSLIFELSKSSKKKESLFKQLSTLKRVNSAKDDPSAMALANSLESSIRGLESANRGISFTQSTLETAHGALSSSLDSLMRARDLAVQSANGTLNDSDRANLQQEFDQQIENVNSISQNTSFNGNNLLDGSFDSNIVTGTDASQTKNISIDSASAASLGVNTAGISTQSSAEDAIESIDAAIANVNSSMANISASYNSLDYASNANAVQSENMAAAKSQAVDADIAELTAELNAQNVREAAQLAALKTKNKDQESYVKKLLGKL